jgi:hypothetical protein
VRLPIKAKGAPGAQGLEGGRRHGVDALAARVRLARHGAADAVEARADAQQGVDQRVLAHARGADHGDEPARAHEGAKGRDVHLAVSNGPAGLRVVEDAEDRRAAWPP